MDNQLVTDLKKLLRCYDLCSNENSGINREIRMWRDRYCDEKLSGNKTNEINAREYFRTMTSEYLMGRSLESQLEIIKQNLLREND